MNDFHVFQNCARRFSTIEIPTEAQKIRVAPTPFERDGKPILLGKRSEGFLIALIPNHLKKIRENQIEGPLSNGFELSLIDLNDEQTDEFSSYLEFRNIGNIDTNLFGALLDEVLSSIDGDSGHVVDEIKRVIEKWKYMLSLESEKKLDTQAIIGLFGELLLLERLMELQGADVFKNWVGPLGNRHDFEFELNSIEVKTTTSKSARELTVHGLDQLEPYPGKKVIVFKIRLELDPAGISLPALIDRVLEINLVNQEKFFEKLSRVGYVLEHKESYADLRFQPVLFQVIPVDSQFPRISRTLLKEMGCEDRILDIQYVINVAGLDNQSEADINKIDFEGLM
jgi:hypothetical protein